MPRAVLEMYPGDCRAEKEGIRPRPRHSGGFQKKAQIGSKS